MKNFLAIYFRDVHTDLQTECLRYMGNPPCLGVCGGWYIYHCPKGLRKTVWHRCSIECMATLGVVAKVWQLDKNYPNVEGI